MEYELLLLILPVFLLTFDVFKITRSRGRQNSRSGIVAVSLAAGLVVIAYGLLVVGYVVDDFSLAVVYTYSSSSLPLLSKICAAWAGAAGSILFLTVLVVITYFAYRFISRDESSRTVVTASQTLGVLAIFFVLMSIGKSPFTRLDVMPLDGIGLNPALKTPWMMVHPPIVFIGYAFILLAFAISLGGIKTDKSQENRLLKTAVGLAWLLMTLGIAVGGLWAYEVLGWGGYWSWDPVETGSLLVWLALTAFFFARPLSKHGKNLLRQFTLFVAFAALIFLSALTRGGLLNSVHAYALSPAGPILIALALIFGAYFYYLKRQSGQPIFTLKLDKSSVGSMSLTLSYFSLTILFLVSFLGIAVPVVEQLWTTEPSTPASSFYNAWSFPFASLLIIAMIGYSLREWLTVRKLAALGIGSIAVGAILVVAGWPTSDFLANLGMPLLVVGFVVVGFDLVVVSFMKKPSLKSLGRKLLFFGMTLGLIGILFSSAMKETASLTNVQFSTNGVATVQNLELSIVLRNWTAYGGEGRIYSTDSNSVVSEYSSAEVTAEIYRGSEFYSDSLWAFAYTNYGPVAQPLILHTTQGDIYMHLEITDAVYRSLQQSLMGVEASSPGEVSLTVSIVPLTYLLWIGVAVMCLGISLNVISDLRKPKFEDDSF